MSLSSVQESVSGSYLRTKNISFSRSGWNIFFVAMQQSNNWQRNRRLLQNYWHFLMQIFKLGLTNALSLPVNAVRNVLTVRGLLPASSYHDTTVVFSTRVYSPTTWHPSHHVPRAGSHVIEISPGLVSHVIVAARHKNTILTQRLYTEVLSEMNCWRSQTGNGILQTCSH